MYVIIGLHMEACSKFWNQIISYWIHFSKSVLLDVIAVNLQDVVLSKFQQRVVLGFVDTEKQMNYWQCVLTYIEIHCLLTICICTKLSISFCPARLLLQA